jgi:excisionase family DNA binding protein
VSAEKRRFLTIEQVAEELNVGMPMVRTLVRTGELRALQVGGRRGLARRRAGPRGLHQPGVRRYRRKDRCWRDT